MLTIRLNKEGVLQGRTQQTNRKVIPPFSGYGGRKLFFGLFV